MPQREPTLVYPEFRIEHDDTFSFGGMESRLLVGTREPVVRFGTIRDGYPPRIESARSLRTSVAPTFTVVVNCATSYHLIVKHRIPLHRDSESIAA
jgi:hypothetical protein